MSAATFLSILAAALALIASLFFCVGTTRLSNETMYLLSGTYYGGNRGLFEAVAQQRADYLCGTVLLPASFLIQVIVLTVPSLTAQSLFSNFGAGVSVLCIIVAVVVLLAILIRRRLTHWSREYWATRLAADKAAEGKS